jgi:glycosyltransferase involved in cell wall biosynthesis
MRILVISNVYPPVAFGGYERRCAHTMEWLQRRHDVLVLTSRLKRRGLAAEPGILRELPFLPESPLGVLRAPLESLRAARTVRAVLRRYRPDLVFVWNASNIPRAAVRIVQRWDAPVAFSLADHWLGYFVEGDLFLRQLVGGRGGLWRVWSALARLVNRLPSLRVELQTPLPVSLTWDSGALRDLTSIPAGVLPVLDRVIHPASDNEALFAGIERSPAARITIAYVGRLEPEKAPDLAIRALALLRDGHGIDARLVVMGTGERAVLEELEALTSGLALDGAVELRGQLPVEGVAAGLAEAHAMVIPSRWQEPFGLVCLEAALARVPVVASRSGGMPEMLRPDEEALFFPIDDERACAEALARTLTDRAATEERVRRAHEHAREYSLENYRAAYEAFVEDARTAGLAALERQPSR